MVSRTLLKISSSSYLLSRLSDLSSKSGREAYRRCTHDAFYPASLEPVWKGTSLLLLPYPHPLPNTNQQSSMTSLNAPFATSLGLALVSTSFFAFANLGLTAVGPPASTSSPSIRSKIGLDQKSAIKTFSWFYESSAVSIQFSFAGVERTLPSLNLLSWRIWVCSDCHPIISQNKSIQLHSHSSSQVPWLELSLF